MVIILEFNKFQKWKKEWHNFTNVKSSFFGSLVYEINFHQMYILTNLILLINVAK